MRRVVPALRGSCFKTEISFQQGNVFSNIVTLDESFTTVSGSQSSCSSHVFTVQEPYSWPEYRKPVACLGQGQMCSTIFRLTHPGPGGINGIRGMTSTSEPGSESGPLRKPPSKDRQTIKFKVSGSLPQDFKARRITKDDVEFSFARSSGAGGQNVNKVNTKVDMRWLLRSALWLPLEVREAIAQAESNRISSDGFLVVQSQKFRTQSQNLDDALARIQEIVDKGVQACVIRPPDPEAERRATSNMRRANERRLQEKKKSSERKGSKAKDWD